MINLIFSMDGPRLTSEQAASLSAFAQWVVLNERNGCLLVDGIGKPESVAGVMATLVQMGRSPETIGAWDMDGAPVPEYPLAVAQWVDVAPDIIVNELPVRPVDFSEIHGWAGWGPKQVEVNP